MQAGGSRQEHPRSGIVHPGQGRESSREAIVIHAADSVHRQPICRSGDCTTRESASPIAIYRQSLIARAPPHQFPFGSVMQFSEYQSMQLNPKGISLYEFSIHSSAWNQVRVLSNSASGAGVFPKGCRRTRAFQRLRFARFGARTGGGRRSAEGRREVSGRSDRESTPPIGARPHARGRRPVGTNAHRGYAEHAHPPWSALFPQRTRTSGPNPRRTSPDMPTKNSRDDGSVNPNYSLPLRPNAVARRAGSR